MKFAKIFLISSVIALGVSVLSTNSFAKNGVTQNGIQQLSEVVRPVDNMDPNDVNIYLDRDPKFVQQQQQVARTTAYGWRSAFWTTLSILVIGVIAYLISNPRSGTRFKF